MEGVHAAVRVIDRASQLNSAVLRTVVEDRRHTSMAEGMSRLGKHELKQRAQELRALLNEWDPIGLGPGGPEDEYDCLVWPIMRRLDDNLPAAELTAFLETELEEHFRPLWRP